MALFSPTTTTSQQLIFDPAAKDTLNRELQYYGGVEQPRQQAQMQSLLDILRQQGPTGARAQSPGYSGLTNLLGVAPAAMAHAGSSRGIQTPEFSNALATLHASAPQLVELLRQYALQSAGKTQGIVNPQFAELLRPDVFKSQTTEQGTGTQVLQGAGTALKLYELLKDYL